MKIDIILRGSKTATSQRRLSLPGRRATGTDATRAHMARPNVRELLHIQCVSQSAPRPISLRYASNALFNSRSRQPQSAYLYQARWFGSNLGTMLVLLR